MHRQPVFDSPYFRKATGSDVEYRDEKLVNSINAEETLIWISNDC